MSHCRALPTHCRAAQFSPQSCASRHSSVKSISLRSVALRSSSRVAPRRSHAFRVQANELNRWADKGGMDDDCAHDYFDRTTAAVVMRVLTAQATKRVLHQLQESDLIIAQWLNHFCAEHPPLDGNKFILSLLSMKGTTVDEAAFGVTHHINPQNIAHRILMTREDMALNMAQGLSKYATQENGMVLRRHLENTTYLSGGHDTAYKSRRGYHRPRP
ncbi:RBCX2 [Auxenochlorella protothecoides x Auxenochlorella symbiontica]